MLQKIITFLDTVKCLIKQPFPREDLLSSLNWYILLFIQGRASITNKLINTRHMPQKTNSAFMKPMNISPELAEVVGKGPMPRSEVVKKLWVYIKGKGLQDPNNKRNINADEALKKVFGGKAVVNMFEMTKLVSKHLS